MTTTLTWTKSRKEGRIETQLKIWGF